MKAIITVDVGTTSMRAILYDADGRLIEVSQHENMPDSFPDGRVEQNAGVWPSILLTTLQHCALAAKRHGYVPAGIAVTAQRSSVIPVDASGTPLHPAIMWQDRRTAALAQAMNGDNARVYQTTGLKISPVFSALKMTWLRQNRPDIWNRTHKLIGIQDWVLYLLTGRFVTDHTFGSRTNLFNLQTRDWEPALLTLFGVEPHMLCELVPPGSIVGGLTQDMARATGLEQGLPIISAGGDQQCAALGLGLFAGDRAVTNTGTGSYLIAHSDRPVFDPRMRVACNVAALPGAYIVEAAVLTSGTIYRWFNESLGTSDSTAGSFETLNAEAAQAPAGANGLLLLPHFKGSGAPYWDPESKGVFFNVTLNTTRGEMARAILEGIAVEMKGSLELLESLCGPVHLLAVSGGLTKSDLFNQIQSDIFERPIARFANNEATSLGAWIAGAVAVGLHADHAQAFTRATQGDLTRHYAPDRANQTLYERQCRRSRALYEALATPEFRELMK